MLNASGILKISQDIIVSGKVLSTQVQFCHKDICISIETFKNGKLIYRIAKQLSLEGKIMSSE